MKNIWQVTSSKGLTKLIDNCVNKFIIIGIALNNNSQNEKNLIKKFFKSTNKDYPNITFIYYELNELELGKGISILKNNKAEYPYLYHIYDKDKILVNVSNVNEETLTESFEVVKKFYDDDKNKGKLDIDTLDTSTSASKKENVIVYAKTANSLEDDRSKIDKIVKLSEKMSLEMLEDIKMRKNNK